MSAAVRAVLCGLGLSAPVAAQTPRVLPGIEGETTTDGRVTESAWEPVSPLSLTMYQPPYEDGVKEPSEIRVTYDDTFASIFDTFKL